MNTYNESTNSGVFKLSTALQMTFVSSEISSLFLILLPRLIRAQVSTVSARNTSRSQSLPASHKLKFPKTRVSATVTYSEMHAPTSISSYHLLRLCKATNGVAGMIRRQRLARSTSLFSNACYTAISICLQTLVLPQRHVYSACTCNQP